jgi:HB1, ASXL, restriction endonuclease HTH domain
VPDRYRFDHLGDDVRCIDCPTGGPLGRWPDHKRAAHARSHDHRIDLRPRNLLAAAANADINEEKEATAMATSSKGESAKQVAIDILRQAGKPLQAKEIAKQVLASDRCAGLKGKTPEATISAMLAVGSKPGGPFKRVGKGTYTLADTSPASADAAQPAAAAVETKPTQPSAAAANAKPTQTPKPIAPSPKRATAKRTVGKRQASKRSR